MLAPFRVLSNVNWSTITYCNTFEIWLKDQRKCMVNSLPCYIIGSFKLMLFLLCIVCLFKCNFNCEINKIKLIRRFLFFIRRSRAAFAYTGLAEEKCVEDLASYFVFAVALSPSVGLLLPCLRTQQRVSWDVELGVAIQFAPHSRYLRHKLIVNQ
jgi:hypothetical protein